MQALFKESKLFEINRDNRGVSLMELLIYVALMAISVTALISLLYPMYKTRNAAGSSAEVQQNARLIFDNLTQEIKGAEIVTLPVAGENGDTLTIQNPSAETTTFNVADFIFKVNKNETSEKAITTSNVKIVKRNVSGTDQPYFTNITNTNAKPTIKIQFRVEYVATNPDQNFNQDYQTTIMVGE